MDNYYLKSADILVSYLNTLLDKQYQIISFGDNLNLKSDTIVYYLPEFMNENLVLQDTNFRITDITCYKKGYLGTEILDSMIQCKCRISPKNEFYATKYWEVYRLDDRNWKREYYDNDGHISKVEYIREILPFEIVHEVIEVYEGLKPSVIIKNYYKTEIINKKE